MAGKALLLGGTLVAGIGAMVWAAGSMASRQMCKPVVPRIVIDGGDSAVQADVDKLYLFYDERGSVPYSDEAFEGHLRHSFCEVEDGTCTNTRARYEVRFDPDRHQSIQIRRSSGTGERLLGAVRWNGPAYPERVEISCDFTQADPRRSCRVTGLDYSADPDADWLSPGARMHDRCRP